MGHNATDPGEHCIYSLGNWMEHDPAGQTLKAVLQELYQRDAVNTYLRDGEIETEKKREREHDPQLCGSRYSWMSEHGRNQLCPAVPSVLTKTSHMKTPGRKKTPSVDVDYRREFTLEASQQQSEVLGREGNTLIKTRKVGSISS